MSCIDPVICLKSDVDKLVYCYDKSSKDWIKLVPVGWSQLPYDIMKAVTELYTDQLPKGKKE